MPTRQARLSFPAAEQAAEARSSSAIAAAAPPAAGSGGLLADPIRQKMAVRQLACIDNASSGLTPPGVEGEQRGDGGDHVLGAKTCGVGGIELDGDVVDAALVFADAGLEDEGAQQGRDGATGGAPRGSPEGEQGHVGGGREGQVGVEGVGVTDAVGEYWSVVSGVGLISGYAGLGVAGMGKLVLTSLACEG